jgi:hypothetical protein
MKYLLLQLDYLYGLVKRLHKIGILSVEHINAAMESTTSKFLNEGQDREGCNKKMQKFVDMLSV